jgi:hypothetical protein
MSKKLQTILRENGHPIVTINQDGHGKWVVRHSPRFPEGEDRRFFTLKQVRAFFSETMKQSEFSFHCIHDPYNGRPWNLTCEGDCRKCGMNARFSNILGHVIGLDELAKHAE